MSDANGVLKIILRDARTGYEEHVATIHHEAVLEDGATAQNFWAEVARQLEDAADSIPRPDPEVED